MITCFDVQYETNRDGTESAKVAAVCFQNWTDAKACHEQTITVAGVAPYVPGQFFRRELPGIIELYQMLPVPIETIVIDGYVWLGSSRPGLGAELYEALDRSVPVVGVAKKAFADNDDARAVCRGDSQSPLFVTSVGMPTAVAVDFLKQMHGEFRMPTLLKRVDQLARGLVGTQ